MFIKKEDYIELCKRIDTLERGVSALSAALLRQKQADANAHAGIRAELGDRALRTELSKYANANDITDVLFGFAQDIDDLKGDTATLKETVEDSNSEFQQERQFLAGIHNINTFTGVTKNGN